MTLALPAWPDASTSEGQTFFANATAIFKAWKAKGCGNPMALAMVAQAEAESSLDPNTMGDYVDAQGKRLAWSAHPTGTPTAFGLYQRHPSRLEAIKAALGIDIVAAVKAGRNTVENDVEAAWWELKVFPYLGLAAIESQGTSYGAAIQACALFERAGAANAAQRRGAMAERWSAHIARMIGP